MPCRALPAAVALAVLAPVAACTGDPPFQHLAGPGKATLVAYHADLAELPRFTVRRDSKVEYRRSSPRMPSRALHPPTSTFATKPQVTFTRALRPTGGSHHGYPTAVACVMTTENGGSYGRSSNPTHFGRYQFDRQTWAAYGGLPADWGYASPAEQDAVFAIAVARGGLWQGWLRWDGC